MLIMNDKYWYNIKQENGVTVIEKVNADGYVEQMNNNPPAYNQNYNYNYNYDF